MRPHGICVLLTFSKALLLEAEVQMAQCHISKAVFGKVFLFSLDHRVFEEDDVISDVETDFAGLVAQGRCCWIEDPGLDFGLANVSMLLPGVTLQTGPKFFNLT